MKTLLIFCLVFIHVKSWKCPQHCFCYKWKDMLRTDCVRKNLYNTFVTFSSQTQVLDLSHNVISILHGNEFLDANLKQLKHVILCYNRLYKVDKFSFNGLHDLEYIDLSNNKIEHLDAQTFNYNPNLKTLNLSFNPLSMNKPFLNVPSLLELNTAGCNVKYLKLDIFDNLEKLQTLNMSHNLIQKIDLDILKPLKNIQHIDISKNDLICNSETQSLIEWLRSQRIQFPPFCQTSQRMVATEVFTEEINEVENLNVDIFDNWTTTTNNFTESQPIFDNIFQFFQSIPFYYVILFGIQLGILIGSLITCLCLRKQKKSLPYSNSGGRFVNNNPDNSTFTLIPLRTPPGTPPSPYRSRLIFPSSFSLNR